MYKDKVACTSRGSSYCCWFFVLLLFVFELFCHSQSSVFILRSDLSVPLMSFEDSASVIQQIIIDNCAKNAVVHILGKYSIYFWVISFRDFFEGESLGSKCIKTNKLSSYFLDTC